MEKSETEDKGGKKSLASNVTVIHVEELDKMNKTPAKIMEELLGQFDVPEEKQVDNETFLYSCAINIVSDAPVHICPISTRILRLQNEIKISPGSTPGPFSPDLLQPAD